MMRMETIIHKVGRAIGLFSVLRLPASVTQICTSWKGILVEAENEF